LKVHYSPPCSVSPKERNIAHVGLTASGSQYVSYVQFRYWP
jgi:hypothetical protein